jgi:hypothetical protein
MPPVGWPGVGAGLVRGNAALAALAAVHARRKKAGSPKSVRRALCVAVRALGSRVSALRSPLSALSTWYSVLGSPRALALDPLPALGVVETCYLATNTQRPPLQLIAIATWLDKDLQLGGLLGGA